MKFVSLRFDLKSLVEWSYRKHKSFKALRTHAQDKSVGNNPSSRDFSVDVRSFKHELIHAHIRVPLHTKKRMLIHAWYLERTR